MGAGEVDRLEALIRAVLDTPDVILTAGTRSGIAELMGRPAVRADAGWLALEAESWHLHLNLADVAEARFETEPSAELGGGTSYSIAFAAANGERVFTAYFTEMEHPDHTPRQERVDRFWALRDRCGGDVVRFAPADP